MNDLTFLDEELANEYGAIDAILKAVLPGGKVIHISDAVSPFKFLETCPLLYHAFEYNSQSRLQASVDVSSETAIISLARYCYTGSYLATEPDGESILLLQHAETYKIAEDFDVPELQIMAHGNFSCQIEYSCCLPEPPKDLLETIRFIYRHFASDEARRKHNLVDTLLNYCVAVYLYHKLGESLDFLTAVHEISAFRQDLCRTNIARNFEDDCAADIIRLPSGPMAASGSIPTILASRELPNEMLYDLPHPRKHSVPPTMSNPAIAESMNRITLSYRRGQMGMQTSRQDIPDRSKHCVSPSALAAALENCAGASSSTDGAKSSAAEESPLHRYKRARIEEATARLEGWPVLPEADPSTKHSEVDEKPVSIKVEADEDSYWAGAFGQTDSKSSNVALENRARRLLYEYGRSDDRPAQDTSSGSREGYDNAPTNLPHRARSSEEAQRANLTTDSASEDEGFAMVQRSQTAEDSAAQSPMSSPELLPADCKKKEPADDKALSDDEWTML